MTEGYNNKLKPELSKRAFDDVNMGIIDYNKQSLFVMERILNNGTDKDFRAMRSFYGDKRIRKERIYSQDLGPKEVSFCCLIFKLKIKDFRYKTNRPANPEPWDYSGA